MRDRRQIRCISFNEIAVGWHECGDLADVLGILEGDDAGERDIAAERRGRVRARSWPAVKQCRTKGKAPCPASSVRIAAMSSSALAAVDNQWKTGDRGRPRYGGEGPWPGPRAGRCRRNSRGRLRRWQRSVGGQLRRTRSSVWMCNSLSALCGWVPTEHQTFGYVSAMAAYVEKFSTSVDIVTIPVTPTAAARAKTPSMSPASASKSRWQ